MSDAAEKIRAGTYALQSDTVLHFCQILDRRFPNDTGAQFACVAAFTVAALARLQDGDRQTLAGHFTDGLEIAVETAAEQLRGGNG